MNKKHTKPVPLTEMTPLVDATIRIPGRAAELMRLAMMHDLGARHFSMKAMIGKLCEKYAQAIIAERGVSVPAHLMDCNTKGGAR